MINFLKKLFGLEKKKEEILIKSKRSHEHRMDHDIIDYDGMGNQGRFPTHR